MEWFSFGGLPTGDQNGGFALDTGLEVFFLDNSNPDGDFVFFYNSTNEGEVEIIGGGPPEIPEPSSLVLAVLALVGLLAHGRRRRA